MPTQNVNFGLTINQRAALSISRFLQQNIALFQQLRVAVPAIVQTFSPGPPATVSVTVAINEDVQWNTNGTTGPLNLRVQKMTPGDINNLGGGLIQDIPVMSYGAGGWIFTLPIQQGDECLLVFNDLEIDNWFANGGVNNNTISSRRHDLSDAVAIFGLWSKPRGVSNYSTTSAQIRNTAGTIVIDLSPTGISITTGAGETINLNAQGTVNINSSIGVNVNGAGNVTLDGRNFLHHLHSGVQSGPDTTGPVL